MALKLSFELRLEERCGDRVVVSVLLAPSDGKAVLDGVALQLFGRDGEPIGVRMLLPIAGELHHPMLSTLELKVEGEIPAGARVVGTAWRGAEQREATLPTDPFTELEVHLRARRRLGPVEGDLELERLTPEERARLARDFPWVDEPRLPKAAGELTVVEHEGEDLMDELVENLGLDEENAEWLKALLDEEDSAVE